MLSSVAVRRFITPVLAIQQSYSLLLRPVKRYNIALNHKTCSYSIHSPDELGRSLAIMAKRKSSTLVQTSATSIPLPSFDDLLPPAPKRRASHQVSKQLTASRSMNPDVNPDVLDGPEALRASPDAEEKDERLAVEKLGMEGQIKEDDSSGSSLSELSDVDIPPPSRKSSLIKQSRPMKAKAVTNKSSAGLEAASTKSINERSVKEPQFLDPEADGEEEVDEEEVQAALSRPPPVHSDYLPLPWKGRLGYVRQPLVFYAFRQDLL